ncbi:MAG: citrate synthase family protein [Gaiellaceae bacterium]
MAISGDYLTAHEAAEYLGVSRATLYAYVSRGFVASEPAGAASSRSHRYARRALDELKERRTERREPAHGALAWGAPVLDSSLSLIADGRLYYRGLDACELSRNAAVEDVARLLWTGATDGADELFPLSSTRRRRSGSLGDRLFACLAEERAWHPVTISEPNPAALRAAAATISALFDAAGATGSGSLAERLARGWRAPDAGALGAALILCADHELNSSAFTARCVASTDAPIHNVLLGALCAFEGRRHGPLARVVCDLLDDVELLGVEAAGRRALARQGLIPGFGHRLYPDGDPRAVALLDRLELAADHPAAQLIAFAEQIGAAPTLEVAVAALARHPDLPDDATFGIFALGRAIGWVGHALETAAQGTVIRPRARYTGPQPA